MELCYSISELNSHHKNNFLYMNFPNLSLHLYTYISMKRVDSCDNCCDFKISDYGSVKCVL